MNEFYAEQLTRRCFLEKTAKTCVSLGLSSLLLDVDPAQASTSKRPGFEPAYLKLQKTGEPIKFRQTIPFLQLQLMKTSQYQNTKEYEVYDCLADVPQERWEDYYNTIVKPAQPEIRAKGQYAKMTRKKKNNSCPVSHTA